MVKKFLHLGCLTLVILSQSAIAAGDAAAGQGKAAACAACHGPDGNSMNPAWPSLAGQHASYIVKQLQDFKADKRVNPMMSGMAKGLSDQDMEDIAAYYASQTLKPAQMPAGTEMRDVEVGEKIYRAGDAASGLPSCMGCHGPGGSGNPMANYPRLNSQHSAYTIAQLEAFKAETRANDANAMMRSIASKLTKDQIRAVAEYLQGL